MDRAFNHILGPYVLEAWLNIDFHLDGFNIGTVKIVAGM
jgi:hypothetical protein